MIIEVRIGNNKYKLNCRAEESDKILEYSDRLDARLKEIRENIEENISEEHLLVIAGLVLEQELQDKINQMSGEHQLYTEDDLYEALSEQTQNITDYINKIISKIENS